MQYDLNDLYYYVKVVEHGGFSQAGLALGVPKSKLSRRIADLEKKLNVSLIYRSTRQFHVTDVGQVFYQQCKNVVDEAEIAHELICSVQSHPKGTIKLSCPVALLQVYLNELLVDFMAQYPDIDIQILAVNRPVDVISE
ncbi:LysR family transcriptional regulator, partial [Providencia vermicola]